MTPDREADEQARRLAAKVADCRDRPEQMAKRIVELEDHTDWQSAEIAKMRKRITKLEERT